MSRIHEALARANDTHADTTPMTTVPREVAALEQYAQEGREGRHALVDQRHLTRPLPAPRPPAVVDQYRSIVPAHEFDGKVVAHGMEHTGSAEQYASLATALHETQLDRGLQTLLVTSATPQEGKTLTVVNLAITLSSSYARQVLIVDADLRRPSVHRAFGISADLGLSDALSHSRGELPIVQVSPHLSILPAGRPDPNPLVRLSQDRLQQVLEECAARFDWVLVDTPPLGTAADAQLVARFVQGVIFVIRAGAAPYHVVDKAVAQLGRESIIGTVLNGVDEGAAPAASPYTTLASAS
jgi:capsular exopolysaccharide synthesis family protein